MELEFSKVNESYVAEFEVTSDFNLHLEGVPENKVLIYQRGTAMGQFAFVECGTPRVSYDMVYDFDFSALVYPKHLRVMCEVEPTYAEVTFRG